MLEGYKILSTTTLNNIFLYAVLIIIGLYTNKINFRCEYGLLTVGRDWNNGRFYNQVRYNQYKDGWWHVEHYYKGYWLCQAFETCEEVLDFFIQREPKGEWENGI